MKDGPIILVEDDVDDQEFITEALRVLDVTNEIKIFENGLTALEFLKTTASQPFIIISDVNLPVMNGLQLKAAIHNDDFLRNKSIPFIFLSTSAEPNAVTEAYNLFVQGFFVKENSYNSIKAQLKQVIDYWQNCKHPNNSTDHNK